MAILDNLEKSVGIKIFIEKHVLVDLKVTILILNFQQKRDSFS